MRFCWSFLALPVVLSCARAREPLLPSDAALLALCAPRGGAVDEDADGLPDDCEQELAERFAPVVYHSLDESNFPTSVDRFLQETALSFFDASCGDDGQPVARRVTQKDLLGVRRRSCAGGALVVSDGSRSASKMRTFYLEDVRVSARRGSVETRDWTTYVHTYKNDRGGVTVQYWRLYAYNDGYADHGGDWEGIHVVLDAALRPERVRMLQHYGIVEAEFASLDREGTHARIYSEPGGHATLPSGDAIATRGCGQVDCAVDPLDPRTHVRQETWSGGDVRFPGKAPTRSGGLVNVGEKQRPMNGQHFVAYSGLWGSPGTLFVSSGYWGPAFNETSMRDDGFVTAWCAGMTGDAVARECYPASMMP